jgi:hypothetical protein
LIAKFAFWEILDIVIGKVYVFTSMTDQKRQALNDLYQQLDASRIPYSHNFLRCVAQSQQALQAILQSSNEQTLNQMLAWARNSLKNSVEITLEKALENNNTSGAYHLYVIEWSIANIDTVLWTTVVPFDQEIRAIYTIIWQPTNDRARFCNEAWINQKFHAYWIVNWAQFTALQSNPALVERFLRLCESTWCSPAVVASFREVLLPNTRINQTNSPQTRAAVIAAMRQDPVFEETITNRTFTDPAQRELLLSYLDWLRDDVTDAEHIRYREWLYDIYYLPFLQRTGRLQNQNRHQNKADFFASDECQRYIDEIIRPDFDRFNRITNLNNRNAWVYQNGWRLVGTGDVTGIEFSPTPDSIDVKQNPRVSYDVNSNANNTLKTIDVRDNSNTSIWTFRSNERVPLDVLRRADRVVWTVWVQPQVSMKSLLNNATVAFQAPEEDVTVEMNRDQINNLLASVDPDVSSSPLANILPDESVDVTTNRFTLTGNWEPGRTIEVERWWNILRTTVRSDGTWQVQLTGLTAWDINVEIRMRNTDDTGWETSVNRVYNCTYVSPSTAPEVPTVWNFPRRTWLAWVSVRSAAIPVTWLSAWATVEVHAWPNEFYINATGPFTTPQPVSNGQQITVVWTALPNVWDVETITVNIGSEVRTYEVETIAGPEILELPTISEPWAFVYSNNPVMVKWTAKADSFVELSDSTGRTLGRVKAVWGNWTLSVWRFPVWDHTIRAVACDTNGTPDPTRFTEITFEVGEVWLQNVTATREEINAVVFGETWKQVTIWYRKQWETTWNERSEMMTTSPQTFTRLWLDLTHWTYEVQMKQWTIESTDTFTINAYRVLPDMWRLPRSQDRNPIFYGTAEPNEELTINYKIPWTDEEKEIKVDTDGAWERSFTLLDTITGVYDLKLSCAGENHTINYTSEWVSRRPVMDKKDITIKNSDKDFTLSGFIDRRDLDCESVAVFDGDTEIARVSLGKFSMKNRITRHRSTNSAFSATIAANHIDSDSSTVFTIKPVRQWWIVDDKNISTVTVTKVEDMRNAPREALKTAFVEFNQPDGSKPQLTLSGKLTQTADAKHKIKKIGIRRHTRWAGRVIKRDYQTVGVNDDGTWSVEKLFKNNWKYTYAAAPVIDAEPISGTWLRKSKEVLGKTTYCPFEVQAEANEWRTKRYNPWTRKRPWGKKKSSSADEWDKKADKKWGDAESGSGSSSKWWIFSGLKGLLNGDFLPEPSKSEWKSLVQRWKNIVNGDNDLVKALEWKKSESK